MCVYVHFHIVLKISFKFLPRHLFCKQRKTKWIRTVAVIFKDIICQFIVLNNVFLELFEALLHSYFTLYQKSF